MKTKLQLLVPGFALLAWMLISGLVPARAGVVDSFKVGSWHVDAFTNDSTGNFDSCVGIVRYRSGISMSVQVDAKYDWWIGFSAPGWTMTPGEKIQLQYRIDRGPWQVGTAEAVSPELARMAMPTGGYIITRFRRGHTLYVYDGAYNYDFRLTGTSRLMASMARCVETNSRRFGAGAPMASNAAPAPGATPVAEAKQPADPQLQIEATQALFNLMGNTGLLGLNLVGEAERDDNTKGIHAVARNDARIVTAHILNQDSFESEQAVLSEMIAKAAKTCEGDFSSGSSRKTVNDKNLQTGQSECTAGDYELKQRYAVAPRSAGGVYVFALSDIHVGEGGGTAVSPGTQIAAEQFNAAVAAVSK